MTSACGSNIFRSAIGAEYRFQFANEDIQIKRRIDRNLKSHSLKSGPCCSRGPVVIGAAQCVVAKRASLIDIKQLLLLFNLATKSILPLKVKQ